MSTTRTRNHRARAPKYKHDTQTRQQRIDGIHLRSFQWWCDNWIKNATEYTCKCCAHRPLHFKMYAWSRRMMTYCHELRLLAIKETSTQFGKISFKEGYNYICDALISIMGERLFSAWKKLCVRQYNLYYSKSRPSKQPKQIQFFPIISKFQESFEQVWNQNYFEQTKVKVQVFKESNRYPNVSMHSLPETQPPQRNN